VTRHARLRLYIHKKMVTIHNSDLFKELRDGARSQQLRDGVLPNQLAEKVVPVMEVNPKILRIINTVKEIGSSATGNTTIYTTPADRDFFLTSVYLTHTEDATSDGTGVYIQIVLPDGVTTRVLRFLKTTLTAFNNAMSLPFPRPILLKRNSTIIFVKAFTVGTTNTSGGITGYVVDNSNA